jgi:hypothetical protein
MFLLSKSGSFKRECLLFYYNDNVEEFGKGLSQAHFRKVKVSNVGVGVKKEMTIVEKDKVLLQVGVKHWKGGPLLYVMKWEE